MVALDGLLPGGRRPSGPTLRGLAIGLAGVVVLILPTALHEGWHGSTISSFFVLQISAAGWVLGALLQKRVPTEASPFLIGAIQQVGAGLAVFVPAALLERLPHSMTVRSELAIAYLIVFGSILGFTSFVHSMARLPVALVSIYTFVNPVVAVVLGWLFMDEPFGSREIAAMIIIFAGIALVKWSESRRHSTPGTPEPAIEPVR
jgi:drug/metabolite transporter (DMT)-like permease